MISLFLIDNNHNTWKLNTRFSGTDVTRSESRMEQSRALLNKMSTGKVLPGMWNMGTLPKNEANLSESMVAEVTMSFKSVRRATT